MKRKTIWILAASLALLVMGCNNEPDPVAVESVTVSDSSLKLGVGDTNLLRATVDPWNAEYRTLTWESSAPDIATVSDYGKVTAVSEGTAIITAKAGGKQGTCEVTVCVHSWSDKKCTKCGVGMYMRDGTINDEGVLTRYYGYAAEVVIPKGITGIGKGAFKYNKDIESVTIPSSVKSIEGRGDGYGDDGAFEWCENLKTVTMDEGIEIIGDYAFSGCTSLASVTIPSSVTSIGIGAFYRCRSLTEIEIPSSVKSIESGNSGYSDHGAFEDCTSLASMTIPDSVTSIGSSAFSGCTSLASVTIPASVTSIGSGAFYGTSLASVTYKGTLAQWCAMDNDYDLMSNAKTVTLDGMPNLKAVTKLTIPEGVESIGNSAFYYCTNLTEVEIPNTVKSIGYSAFCWCTSLASVTYKGTLAQWCAMGNDYDLMSNAKTVTLDDMSNLKAVTKLTIPEGVESIGKYAFCYCTNFTEVEIPNTVKSIESSAFWGCTSLTTVTIPASVTSIGSGAFYGCKSLSGVQYGGTQEEWKKINRAKSDYSSTYDDYLTGKKITGADGKPWIAE